MIDYYFFIILLLLTDIEYSSIDATSGIWYRSDIFFTTRPTSLGYYLWILSNLFITVSRVFSRTRLLELIDVTLYSGTRISLSGQLDRYYFVSMKIV